MTHGSLFSGIGGFELGAQMSNIETIWNCEIEERQRAVLNKNFPNSKQYTDIKQLFKPPYVDILSGGFPCQDISISNISNKNLFDENGKCIGIYGERSGLWSEMWRIIDEIRPQYVVFENSPMLITRGLERVISDLAQIGYVLEWQCLFASQFGFPHQRERIYGIAYPLQKRRKDNYVVFGELQKLLRQRAPGQISLPMPIKRFKSDSDYSSVQLYNGFSKELDKSIIEMFGNAVIPVIAHYLFESILNFESLNVHH